MTDQARLLPCCGHEADRHGPEAGGCIECRCRVVPGRVQSAWVAFNCKTHGPQTGVMRQVEGRPGAVEAVCPECVEKGWVKP